MTCKAGWLDHKDFDLIHRCPGVLKSDLNIPGSDRVKICLDCFGTRNNPIEALLVRVIDRGIFHVIIVAVPVCIDIIRQGNCNDKLARITIVEIPKTVPAKRNGVNGPGFTEIDLDPAVGAIADPARSRSIQPVVDIRGVMDPAMTGNRILGNGRTCRPISGEGQVLALIKFLRQAQGGQVPRLANHLGDFPGTGARDSQGRLGNTSLGGRR